MPKIINYFILVLFSSLSSNYLISNNYLSHNFISLLTEETPLLS